ncbi:MAG: hypothetical protein II800_00595 [Lachnospiraceae bacterium]|nr:hypothetical protein [Lachnospiraceae bacterium]
MNKEKLIPPFVMLAATAIVAVVTYVRDFPFATWLIIVISVMVLFLFLGEVITQMILYFIKMNERRKREEEQRAEREQNPDRVLDGDNNPVSDLPPVR